MAAPPPGYGPGYQAFTPGTGYGVPVASAAPTQSATGLSRVMLACCLCVPGQRVDVIEWLDDTRDTMCHRHQRPGNEIKYGARLIVRESQVACFLNEGRLADVFRPGTYELVTANLPVLSSLQAWQYGFNSPFKSDIIYVSTRRFTDLKWGTTNPIIINDPKFGTVRVRAYGTMVLQVVDAAAFVRELVGTNTEFTTDEIQEHVRSVVLSKVARVLATAGVSVADIAGRQDALETVVQQSVVPDMATLGVNITRFIVENVSLPPEVERALDTRTRINMIGNLDDYTRLQAADALEGAATNPGGGGAFMGMSVGAALGNTVAGVLPGLGGGAAVGVAPPPLQSAPPPLQSAPPLPQPPTGAAWFIGLQGQQRGPFDAAGLAAEAAAGRLPPDALAWRQGMDGWAPVRDVPEIAGVGR